MKFKNISNKIKTFKKNKEWINIKPGDIIELGTEANLSEKGLKLIKTEIKSPIEIKDNKKNIIYEKNKKHSKEYLKKLTKDEINDLSAIYGFGNKINSNMKKSSMIKIFLEIQDENNE